MDKLVSDGHDMVARIEEEQGAGSNTRNAALELDTLQGVFQTFLIFIAISFSVC